MKKRLVALFMSLMFVVMGGFIADFNVWAGNEGTDIDISYLLNRRILL